MAHRESEEVLFVVSDHLTASLAPILPCQDTESPAYHLPCYCCQHDITAGSCQSYIFNHLIFYSCTKMVLGLRKA